jgi:hypothetical protein
MSKPIKVTATEPGYYVSRRDKGETFFIKDEKDFSARWMKRAEVPVLAPKADAPKIEPKPFIPAPVVSKPEVTHGGTASPA